MGEYGCMDSMLSKGGRIIELVYFWVISQNSCQITEVEHPSPLSNYADLTGFV